MNLADEAAGLKLDEQTLARASDLKKRIKERQESLQKQEQYDAAVKDARTKFKEQDIDGSLKLLDTALNIQKEGASAVKLQKEVLAEKRRLDAIAEHKREIKDTYETALKSNLELSNKRDFAGALKALQAADAAANELGTVEKETLGKQINEATQKLDLFNKLETGIGDAQSLAKEERYDEALKALDSAAKFMDDPRLPQFRQNFESQRKDLDALVATRLKEAGGALQSGGIDAALTSLQDVVAAHKTRADLARTASALNTIQLGGRTALENTKRLNERLAVVVNRLGTRGSFELDRLNKALDELKQSAPAAASKLASSGIENAAPIADDLKAIQGKALADAMRYMGLLEDIANRPVEQPRAVIPQNDTPRSNGGGGGRSNESDRDR